VAVLVSAHRSPAPGAIVLAALWLHQLVMAYLAPIAGDDWRALVDTPQPTTHDLVLGVLVHAPIVHVIVTPIVAILLVVGACTLALGRRVDLGRDALALAVASTMIWLAAPRAGVDFSNRALAVGELYGTCGAVWLAVAARHAWERPARHELIAPAFVAGLVVGSTSREVGTVAAIAAIALALTKRRATAVAAAVGLAIGAALVWLAPPDSTFDIIRLRGVTRYLHEVVIALRAPIIVAALATLALIVQTARGRAPAPRVEAIPIVAWAIVLAAGVGLVVGFVPKPDYSEPFAAGVAIAVASTHVIVELAADRALRRVAIGLAIVVHAVIAWRSVRELASARADADARIAVIARTPPGSIARAPSLRKVRPTPYVLGEDLRTSALRDRVASLVFGLRAIELDPPVHNVEAVPPIELRATCDGPIGSSLRTWWSVDLATARDQLASALPAIRAAGLHDVELAAVGVAVPGRSGPVVAAWLDGDHVRGLAIQNQGTDELGRTRLVVPGTPDTVWAIELGGRRATALAVVDDAYVLPADHHASYAIVACDASRCALGRVVSFE
jgi:hypothetical protein